MTMDTPMTSAPLPEALTPLCRLSRRLGEDALCIQGAGGNTSQKLGGMLWVKASGTWLRDAQARPIFVPVDLAQVRAGIAADLPDPVTPARRPGFETLRPSIETTLHALMPHAVVLHVHAVDALAWVLRPDGRTAIAQPLEGLAWAWIDYVRPGIDLTRAVRQRLNAEAAQPPDVLVLASHGLVVGGDDVAQAAQRLDEVLERLHLAPRPGPVPDDAALTRLEVEARAGGWRLPHDPALHALALDTDRLAQARAGVPCPDHVVFLGGALACGDPARPRGDTADAPACLAWPGQGLVVRPDLDEAGEAMLACWAAVIARLPEGMRPVGLPPEEVEALGQWEAERFRRSLAR